MIKLQAEKLFCNTCTLPFSFFVIIVDNSNVRDKTKALIGRETFSLLTSFGKLQILVEKVRSIIMAVNVAAALYNNAGFCSYVNFQTFTFVLFKNKHMRVRV